jgi:hypothetical protein
LLMDEAAGESGTTTDVAGHPPATASTLILTAFGAAVQPCPPIALRYRPVSVH